MSREKNVPEITEKETSRNKVHVSYKIIVPKFDNEGHRISVSAIKKYADKMIRHFGGVTIDPKVLGGFESNKKIQYDENAIIYGLRIQSTPDQAAIDKQFMENLAKQVATEFGQEAIMTVEEDPDSVVFVVGKKSKNVPKELRETDFFSQLTD
jgi:hypothetical protein